MFHLFIMSAVFFEQKRRVITKRKFLKMFRRRFFYQLFLMLFFPFLMFCNKNVRVVNSPQKNTPSSPPSHTLGLSRSLSIPKNVPAKVSFLAVQQNLIDAVNSEEKERNIKNSIGIIRKFPGYDLYIFSELSVTGYSEATFEKLDELAEAPNATSETFKRFSNLAKEIKAYIIYSIPTYFYSKGGNEKQYLITMFVVSPAGELVTVYKKNYLFTVEQKYFKQAWDTDVRNPIQVITINGVKIGLAICYDQRYPELWRYMSMVQGAEAFIHILYTAKDFSFSTWHTIVTARAVENQAYVISLNRAGGEYGSSVFVQPGTPDVAGYELTPNYQTLNNSEGAIGGVIDKSVVEQLRQKITVIKDGRSAFPKYKNLD
jgi:predicted amidohydrolase